MSRLHGNRWKAGVRTTALAGLLTALSFGFADTSLRLGATFPGWDKLGSTGAEGRLEEMVVDLARGYARQIGSYCSLPEVFLREGSTSWRSALLFYETYLPYGAREEVLLESRTQRVSIVRRSYGGDAMVVLVEIDDLGVAMAVCGI